MPKIRQTTDQDRAASAARAAANGPQPLPLDDDQAAIAAIASGEHVVAAGAGSGKTHTLCEWVARRLADGVAPSQMLVAAYNASAGAELKKRIAERCGATANGVWAGTLHGLSWKLWRESRPGDPRGETRNVIGTDTCSVKPWQVLGPALRNANLWDVDVKTVLKASERVREMGVALSRGEPGESTLEAFKSVGCGAQSRDIALASAIWETEKAKRNLIDFTDMLTTVYHGAERKEPWAMDLQGRFQYLALDEAQDANPVQVRIIEHLAVGSRCVLWVGDFRQSIYGFRGARPDLLKNRIDNGATLASMRFNHRSGAAIVGTANRFATGKDWHIGGDALSDAALGDGRVTVNGEVDAAEEILQLVDGLIDEKNSEKDEQK